MLNYVLVEQVYPNMRSAMVDIYKRKGVLGLYAGLTPTLMEIVPYAGLQFGFYDSFKRWTYVSVASLCFSVKVSASLMGNICDQPSFLHFVPSCTSFQSGCSSTSASTWPGANHVLGIA